jgi:HAD superfamily hydrolase (TIGR01490 family)
MELIKKHKSAGDIVLLISATIEELVIPIGELLGFNPKNIIAIKTIKENGLISGKTAGVLSFKGGKVTRYKEWLNTHSITPTKTYFYSDSINDLPLLEIVDQPIATNPSTDLLKKAKENHWNTLYL